MPFPTHKPDYPPTRPPAQASQSQPDYSNQPPLLKWGGLYPSRNGKAIVGNIKLTQPRYGETRPFGEILIEQIKQYMAEGKSLRILVFEGRPNPKEDTRPQAPYTIHSTEGLSRDQWLAMSRGEQGAATGGPWERSQEEPNQPTQTEPVPQPMRRGAPRR